MWKPRLRGLGQLMMIVTVQVHAGATAVAQPVSKVLVGEAQLRELPATTMLVGTVRPSRTTVIGAEVEGLVDSLPVREGDFVNAEELVCRLQSDILQLELKAAEQRQESLKAAVEVARAELDRWTQEKQRVRRLSEQDKSNPKELYDAVAEFLIAQNRLRQSKTDLAEQGVQVDLKKTELRKTTIRAPFDGYITALNTEVGQWMSRGGQVVEMIDLERVLVRVDAPESAIRFIRIGDQARVKLDALEETFTGTIKHVIPEAHEQARTFPVDIEIANPNHALRGGLFARAAVRSGPAAQVVAVPKDAVVQQHGIDRIWTVQDAGPQGTMAVPMAISLGAEIGEWVAVTSGALQAGTLVVIRGNERLMPFPAPVIVVHETELSTPSPVSQRYEPPSSSSN